MVRWCFVVHYMDSKMYKIMLKLRRRVWCQWRRWPIYGSTMNGWMFCCCCIALRRCVEEKINIKRILFIVSYVYSIINRYVLLLVRWVSWLVLFIVVIFIGLWISLVCWEASLDVDLDLVCWPNSHTLTSWFASRFIGHSRSCQPFCWYVEPRLHLVDVAPSTPLILLDLT